MSKLNRNEHLAILLESDIYDAKSILESLVRAMGDDEFYKNLNYVMQVEDWDWRVNDEGQLVNIKEGEK